MSVFKIAWRSIQHRGLGSLLTMLSMALGVMTVVAVLTIHGVVSRSFHANSSFGYNVVIGSRGGSMQLTLNTVYYLSRPLEPIPFEYYLAFLGTDARDPFLRNSIAFQAHQAQQATLELADALVGGVGIVGGQAWVQAVCRTAQQELALDQMTLGKPGDFADWAEVVIPLALGDFFSRDLDGASGAYRVIGTTSAFFSGLVLDVESDRKFEFSQGRGFHDVDPEHGYFECVVGSQVAQAAKVSVGESIHPIHGDPGGVNAHIHDQGFSVVGILSPTGTPHDRAVFVNIEGFYLMDDHAKPIEEGRERTDEDTIVEDQEQPAPEDSPPIRVDAHEQSAAQSSLESSLDSLPLEQREVTALLIQTNREDDPAGIVGSVLIDSINNGGFLEPTLRSSQFRPVRAQVAPQAVNPIMEITNLFQNIVDPIRWVLLGLTILICIVSGISILVGIYNSMNQRRHEIAVLRSLGAKRLKVTQIMLAESVMLSLGGGLFGWIAGHVLNSVLSPQVEARAGVRIGFFDFAPRVNWGEYLPLGNSNFLRPIVQYLAISPEFLLIPGMIVLAIIVGVYPAISAYRTDVAKSLGT